ncbi:MAG: NAD(P)/FAD-dependent oxidoreductase [Acetobacteraceae bacterium]
MKTNLRVRLGLAPALIAAVALLSPWEIAGLGLALAASVARNLWLIRGGQWRTIELALCAALAIVAVAGWGWLPVTAGHAQAIILTGLAAGATISLPLGRPWTSDFSAPDYPGATGSPIFHRVNQIMSGLWAALFAFFALAALLALPAWLHWGIAAVAGALSAVLPNLLARLFAARAVRQRAGASWPAPAIQQADAAPVQVVGGGLGGLTAAALLADAGVTVEVHEQHDVAGGFAHHWPRRMRGFDPLTGQPVLFRFDSGVHDVSGWQPGGPVRSVFERLGIDGRLAMRRMDHRFWDHGVVFDPPRDPEAHAEALAVLHPADADGLRRLFAVLRRTYEAMFSTGAARGGIPGPPETAAAMLAFAKAQPEAAIWLDRPWAELLATYLHTDAAKKRVSALAGYVTDQPRTLTVARMVPLFGYSFHGGVYPAGGSGRMAEALVTAIRQRGGLVHTGHEVLRIEADNGGVRSLLIRDTSGKQRRVPASAVVLNGDPIAAARHLLPPGALVRLSTPMRPACSAFGVHLGLRGAVNMPPIVHARTSLGSVGIVAPSVVDPSAAPPGYATLELLALVPQSEAQSWLPDGDTFPPALAAWRRRPDYCTAKAAMGDRLIARAAEVIPNLAERIVFRTDASPATFRRYAWSTGGAIYGIEGRLAAKQPLPGLVLAGAATHGPGVEAVVISGALAAEALVPGLLQRPASRALLAAA